MEGSTVSRVSSFVAPITDYYDQLLCIAGFMISQKLGMVRGI
jgi:hypothetical protein